MGAPHQARAVEWSTVAELFRSLAREGALTTTMLAERLGVTRGRAKAGLYWLARAGAIGRVMGSEAGPGSIAWALARGASLAALETRWSEDAQASARAAPDPSLPMLERGEGERRADCVLEGACLDRWIAARHDGAARCPSSCASFRAIDPRLERDHEAGRRHAWVW